MFPLLKTIRTKSSIFLASFIFTLCLYNMTVCLRAPPGFFCGCPWRVPRNAPCFPPGPVFLAKVGLHKAGRRGDGRKDGTMTCRKPGGKYGERFLPKTLGMEKRGLIYPTLNGNTVHTLYIIYINIFIYDSYPSLLSSSISISRTSKMPSTFTAQSPPGSCWSPPCTATVSIFKLRTSWSHVEGEIHPLELCSKKVGLGKPVISMGLWIITPLIGMKSPQLPIYMAIYRS